MKRALTSILLLASLVFVSTGLAFEIDFKTAATDQDKLTYLVEVEQRILEEHNAMGAQRRADEITEVEFRAYERQVYDKKIMAISAARNEVEKAIKEQMKTSPRWPTADAESSFKED